MGPENTKCLLPGQACIPGNNQGHLLPFEVAQMDLAGPKTVHWAMGPDWTWFHRQGCGMIFSPFRAPVVFICLRNTLHTDEIWLERGACCCTAPQVRWPASNLEESVVQRHGLSSRAAGAWRPQSRSPRPGPELQEPGKYERTRAQSAQRRAALKSTKTMLQGAVTQLDRQQAWP